MFTVASLSSGSLRDPNPLEKALHNWALEVFSRYRKAEAEVIEILQRLDEKKVYLAYGYTSLFQYAVSELKLSEGSAYNFITVARKAREIPEIKTEIKAGNLTVSAAKKIAAVIQPDNQAEWLSKAKTLPRIELEKEVARVNPTVLTPEKAKFVTPERISLQVGVDQSLFEKLKRIQDLLSQSQRRPATMEDALEAMASLYLEKKDPIEKAKRAIVRTQSETSKTTGDDQTPAISLVGVAGSAHPEDGAPATDANSLFPGTVGWQNDLKSAHGKRPAIPAAVKHSVTLRDEGRCSHKDAQGKRCEQKRWLDLHHVRPKAAGGADSVENLQLLCFQHHRLQHGH